MAYKFEYKPEYPSDFINEEKSIEWINNNGGMPHSDYDFVIPLHSDFATGLIRKDDSDPEMDGSTTFRSNYEKTVVLQITSWVGISAGARHIYGHLKVPGVSERQTSGRTMSRFGRGTPNYLNGFKIDITKILDEETMEFDRKTYDPQFQEDFYNIGDNIRQWESFEEDKLKEKAKEVFYKWFTGDWIFKIEED